MENTSVANALMTKDALRLVFAAMHDSEWDQIRITGKAKLKMLLSTTSFSNEVLLRPVIVIFQRFQSEFVFESL